MAELLTIEEENKVIDSFDVLDFYAVLVKEFKPVGAATVTGYATLYGMTLATTPNEAPAALVALGLSARIVYKMYQEFRRLRRALLAAKGFPMREQRGGPGANDGVPPVVAKIRDLQTG